MRVRERAIFSLEFLRDFTQVGSITPSSRSLARALTAEMRLRNGSARVLEVGAGTGVITREILKNLGSRDALDIYEKNPRFATHLRDRVVNGLGEQHVRVFQADILKEPFDRAYDFIICGLPLNNFPPDKVRAIFETFFGALTGGGRLSFYEYILGRRMQAPFVGPEGRRRLKEVSLIMKDFLERFEYRRIPVLANVPPAIAHHLQSPADGGPRGIAPVEAASAPTV